MSFDLDFFGNKLKRCRENLQLSQSEVSSKIGIPLSRIEEFESGRLQPTGDEILILADFYKQDYLFFISNQQKSASEQIDILYRKFGKDFSKQDRWIVQEFIYLCECESFILKSIEFKTINSEFKPQGKFFKQHGIDAAAFLRTQIGVPESRAINDPYSELRKFGFHIFRRKLVNSNISGLFINHPLAGKCILINYSEDIYRQNFTLAHETGHAIFDASEKINISFESDNTSTDLREVRANTFASNFLVPRGLLKNLPVKTWTKDLILDLAIKLSVNTQTLLISLKDSGLIDYTLYNQFRSLKIGKASKNDPELSGVSDKIRDAKKALLERGLSAFYVRKCHEAYSMNLISANRLAEMLLVTDSDLPAVLSLFNLKLSYGD